MLNFAKRKMVFINIKEVISSAIEDEKQEIIKEYDKNLNDLLNESKKSQLYYLLAKTFGNNLRQRKLAMQFLSQNLNHVFFKKAEVKGEPNYITFEDEEFKVEFSTSLNKEIKIKYKNAKLPHTYTNYTDKRLIKLANLTENFLQDKSIKNLKILTEFNFYRYPKCNKLQTIIRCICTYRTCNQKFLDKVRMKQKEDEKQRIEDEKIINVYKKQQAFAQRFVQTLMITDLKDFVDNGWRIDYRGILINGEIKF